MAEEQGSSGESRTRLQDYWLDEASKASEGDTWTGKRDRQRYEWNAPLEIRVPSADGGVQTHLATATNISTVGVGFHCRKELAQYDRVEVLLSGETAGVPAVVKQVTSTIGGYMIGAEFLDA